MKIGIVGSGKIVETCFDALMHTKKLSCVALCVRPGSLEKATKLAAAHLVQKVYTDYKEFLFSEEFDVVYIGIINTLHFQYAYEALQAGKHVILEKPFTVSFEEAKKLSEVARDKKLFLWEAITTLYYPNFRKLEEQLHEIGDIKLIQANYSQYSSRYDAYVKGEVLPAFDPELKGGALYDINIYNLHVVTKLFGMPKNCRYTPNRGHNGVDTSGIAVLEYDGAMAVCCGAKDSESPSGVIIQGTKGYIRWHSPTNTSKELEVHVMGQSQWFKEQELPNRMVFELEEMAKMYEEKDLERCYAYLEHSVQVMEVLEKLF